jgi:hypothetical protein
MSFIISPLGGQHTIINQLIEKDMPVMLWVGGPLHRLTAYEKHFTGYHFYHLSISIFKNLPCTVYLHVVFFYCMTRAALRKRKCFFGLSVSPCGLRDLIFIFLSKFFCDPFSFFVLFLNSSQSHGTPSCVSNLPKNIFFCIQHFENVHFIQTIYTGIFIITITIYKGSELC